MPTWSESRPASNQADYDGTSGTGVSKEARLDHLWVNKITYRTDRWSLLVIRICTFTDFTLVCWLSPRFFE